MENSETIKETMRKCPPAAVEAAIAYRQTGDPRHVPAVVLGIIERFLEPEYRPKIRAGDDSLRLTDDLGVDSLVMVEIIIMIEEVLGFSIHNEDLKNMSTLGDLKEYLDAKLKPA